MAVVLVGLVGEHALEVLLVGHPTNWGDASAGQTVVAHLREANFLEAVVEPQKTAASPYRVDLGPSKVAVAPCLRNSVGTKGSVM